MPPRREIKVGDTVRVCSFEHRGKVVVPEFTGCVTLAQMSGKKAMYYHVRAPDGSEWHRSISELTVVPANDNTPRVNAASG